jgi:hypothetical protein
MPGPAARCGVPRPQRAAGAPRDLGLGIGQRLGLGVVALAAGQHPGVGTDQAVDAGAAAAGRSGIELRDRGDAAGAGEIVEESV